jgi:hypothetical protein
MNKSEIKRKREAGKWEEKKERKEENKIKEERILRSRF